MTEQPVQEEQLVEDHPDDQGEVEHEDAEEAGEGTENFDEDTEDVPDTSEPPTGDDL